MRHSALESLKLACLVRLGSMWTRIPVHWFVGVLPRRSGGPGAWALLAALSRGYRGGPT